jgi:hypothetical protein
VLVFRRCYVELKLPPVAALTLSGLFSRRPYTIDRRSIHELCTTDSLEPVWRPEGNDLNAAGASHYLCAQVEYECFEPLAGVPLASGLDGEVPN